jgi:putative (di)nucleoside polyphosphate hydrolase
MMVLNAQGLVFVGQRLDKSSDAWQMPQGGIDAGEEPREAALRELREEIGTDAVKIIASAPDWLSYDLPEALIPRFWGGKFLGQTQQWFLMRLLPDAIINIHTDHQEFSDYRFVKPEELPDLAVSFKQALYRDILGIFSDYL